MKNSLYIVIVGCGRLGSYLANQLSRAGHSVSMFCVPDSYADRLISFHHCRYDNISLYLAVEWLNALYALKGKIVAKRQLALDAIHIEQDIIKENVGSQDQTTAAFGGFNKIEFGGRQKIVVSPITIEQDKLDSLHKHLMLFFTGFPRNASEIAGEQIRRTPEKNQELKAMMEMVSEALDILNGSQDKLPDFGRLLHESWKIKRGLTPRITTPFIDEVYEAAMKAGALGGKLLGAGGGGFILLFVKPELHNKVEEKLGKLLRVPFRFETLGSQIIYYAREDNF